MSDKNMSIWRQVEKTDPAYAKTTNQGGRAVTSIATLWPVRKATELWGPCGKGWGYEIIEERYDVGIPIFQQQGDTTVKICDSVIHTILLKLWYMDDGARYEIVEYGHTDYIYRSPKHGAAQDSEAPKKSLTDALKKCLSMLGFSADVYGGLFDDRNYVEATKAEFEIQNADDSSKELEDKISELRAWVKKETETYSLINAGRSLDRVYDAHWASVSRRAPALGLDAGEVFIPFQRAYQKQIEILNNKEGITNVQ